MALNYGHQVTQRKHNDTVKVKYFFFLFLTLPRPTLPGFGIQLQKNEKKGILAIIYGFHFGKNPDPFHSR